MRYKITFVLEIHFRLPWDQVSLVSKISYSDLYRWSRDCKTEYCSQEWSTHKFRHGYHRFVVNCTIGKILGECRYTYTCNITEKYEKNRYNLSTIDCMIRLSFGSMALGMHQWMPKLILTEHSVVALCTRGSLPHVRLHVFSISADEDLITIGQIFDLEII